MHGRDIDIGASVDNPVRKDSSNAAGSKNADGVESVTVTSSLDNYTTQYSLDSVNTVFIDPQPQSHEDVIDSIFFIRNNYPAILFVLYFDLQYEQCEQFDSENEQQNEQQK